MPGTFLRHNSRWHRHLNARPTALREIRRVERTLFIVDWLLDADMQRRANTSLNKGEAQHYRMAGLNLLAAIIIYWNTAHLCEAVRQRKLVALTVEPELLAHISPLGWGHILLTGEYRWPKCR